MKCSDAGQCGCLVSRLTILIWKQVGDMQLLSVSQVLMDVSLFQIDNTPTYALMNSLCSRWGRPNGRRAHGRGENGPLLASHRSPYQASDGWHQPRGEAPGIMLFHQNISKHVYLTWLPLHINPLSSGFCAHSHTSPHAS